MFRSAMNGAGVKRRRGVLGLALVAVAFSTASAPYAIARPTNPEPREKIKQKNIAM